MPRGKRARGAEPNDSGQSSKDPLPSPPSPKKARITRSTKKDHAESSAADPGFTDTLTTNTRRAELSDIIKAKGYNVKNHKVYAQAIVTFPRRMHIGRKRDAGKTIYRNQRGERLKAANGGLATSQFDPKTHTINWISQIDCISQAIRRISKEYYKLHHFEVGGQTLSAMQGGDFLGWEEQIGQSFWEGIAAVNEVIFEKMER